MAHVQRKRMVCQSACFASRGIAMSDPDHGIKRTRIWPMVTAAVTSLLWGKSSSLVGWFDMGLEVMSGSKIKDIEGASLSFQEKWNNIPVIGNSTLQAIATFLGGFSLFALLVLRILDIRRSKNSFAIATSSAAVTATSGNKTLGELASMPDITPGEVVSALTGTKTPEPQPAPATSPVKEVATVQGQSLRSLMMRHGIGNFVKDKNAFKGMMDAVVSIAKDNSRPAPKSGKAPLYELIFDKPLASPDWTVHPNERIGLMHESWFKVIPEMGGQPRCLKLNVPKATPVTHEFHEVNAKRVIIIGKFSNSSVVHLRFAGTNDEKRPEYELWLLVERGPKAVKDESVPGRREWTKWFTPKFNKNGGWEKITVSLPKDFNDTFGTNGFQYGGVNAIRFRGNFTMSKITFLR
jgi:hypothetical protein